MAASQRKSPDTVRPQPHRFRMNVPQADESVLAWMKVQDNPSLSLRMLVRENIERHGYIDVMNRPVDQLPKRGRPATSEEESAARPEPAPAAPALHLVPPAAAPDAPAASTDLDLTPDPAPVPELLGIAMQSPALAPALAAPASQPAAAVAPAPDPSLPEPPAGNQMDVNDIFTSIR